MNGRKLALAVSLLFLPVCANAQTKVSATAQASVATDTMLVERVRAQLVKKLGAERAARVTVTAKGGVVRVVAPELALSQRAAVEQNVRAVPGVKDVIAVVGTVTRPPSAAIIGEKGKTHTAGIIGEKSKTRTAGVIGEKSKQRVGTAGIIGEKGKTRTGSTAVIGEKSKARAGSTAVIGEKSKIAGSTTAVIGEKSKLRTADAALADAARARLNARLGGDTAAQLRVSASNGVVTVTPTGTVKTTALQVTKALDGLRGMRQLKNLVKP